MCRQAVRDWLVLLTMEQYMDNFMLHGYDSIARCKLIVSSDLVMMGVDNASHRKLLLDGVQFLINSSEFSPDASDLHRSLEIDEANRFGETAWASKYAERFNFLDFTKQAEEEASPSDVPKMPDLNDLTRKTKKSKSKANQQKRLKCRRNTLDIMGKDNCNYIFID